MAGERVEGQRSRAGEDHERADADSEAAVEPESLPHVVPEKEEPEKREIEREAVEVLQHEREFGLAGVLPSVRFTDRACHGIEEERPVVRLPVVVARRAEQDRRDENEECRRKRPPRSGG